MILNVHCHPIDIICSDIDCPTGVTVSVNDVSQFNPLEVTITNDYYTSFRNANLRCRKVTAEEYLLGKAENWPDHSLLCPEMPIPRQVASTTQLMVPVGTSWSKQAVAFIHAGRAGSIAPLHFDWDYSWVAHACLTGRKRLFLFPPQAGWLLSPVINTSALNIPRFSEPDRRALVSKLGGIEIVLEAGQGILFPSMFWHGVLYEQSSLSISARFESQPGGRPFAALPRSWWLQRLGWKFFQQGYRTEADDFLATYLDACFQRKGGWKERYRRLNALCRQTLLHYGEYQGAEELIGENFSIEMALASRELRFWYGSAQGTKPFANEFIQEAMEYIFEAKECKFAAFESQLAAYALRVRQGLPPKRGFIEIKQSRSVYEN